MRNLKQFIIDNKWTTPIWLFVPLGVFFITQGWGEYSLWVNIFVVVLGYVLWTAFEYYMHRILFHSVYKSKKLMKIRNAIHWIHHGAPKAQMRIGMTLVATLCFLVIFFILFRLLFGASLGYIASGAFLIGYVWYDFMHYAIHQFNFKVKWFQELRDHHDIHHYINPDSCYGVSTKLWDWVFHSFNEKPFKKGDIFEQPQQET